MVSLREFPVFSSTFKIEKKMDKCTKGSGPPVKGKTQFHDPTPYYLRGLSGLMDELVSSSRNAPSKSKPNSSLKTQHLSSSEYVDSATSEKTTKT